MSALHPGRLRHRLALEAPVEVPDGAGGVVRSYAAVATVWAAIAPLGAATRSDAGQAAQAVTHEITLRWRADVTGAHRLTKGARVFEIRGVHDPDETGRILVVEAEEIRP